MMTAQRKPFNLNGREEILGRAAAALRSRSCQAVLLVAEAGMGKSALIDALRAELDTEFHIVRLHASSALSSVPYGILAPLMSGMQDSAAESPVEMLRAFLSNFEGVTGPKLIIVDDADDLDEATMSILVELVSARWAKLAIAYQPRPGVAHQITELWYEGLAERFDIPPLNYQQVRQLVEQHLGGPMDDASAQLLWRASDGNPWYLRCFLDDLLAGEGLLQHNGLWLLAQSGVIPGSGIEVAVDSILSRRSPQEREALNLVALAGPVLRQIVEEMVGAGVVSALVEHRLLRVTGEAGKSLILSQSFLAVALRRMVPAARSLQLHQQYISLLGEQPSSKESCLAMVKWSLDCGLPVSDQELLRAALLAGKFGQNDYSLRAATAVHGKEHRLRARALIARAQLDSGQLNQAAQILEEDFLSGENLSDLLVNTLMWARLRLSHGGGPEELRLGAIKLLAAGQQLSRSNPDSAKQIEQAVAERAALFTMLADAHCGDYEKVEAGLEELKARFGKARNLSPVTRIFRLVVRAEHLLALGKFVSCLKLLNKAMALANSDTEEVFDLVGYCQLLYSRAAINSGRWQDATISIDEYSGGKLSLIASERGLNSARGMVLLRQGRAAEASALLRGTLELARRKGGWMFPRVAASGFYAATLTGNTELAKVFWAEAEKAIGAGSEMTQIVAGYYLALGKELAERNGEGLKQLRALGERAHSKRLYGLELYACLGCLELGSDQQAPRVVELVREVEGDWLIGWGKYAEAIVSADPRAFRQAGEFLFERQIFHLAAVSFSRSAELFGAQGHSSERQHSLELLAEAMRQIGPAAAAILKVLGRGETPVGYSPDVLTKRERTIVSLVAKGATNREIAESLTLSVRTVEGHLYRSYAKLGVSGREDLLSNAARLNPAHKLLE
ncbi:LuxR C-terminal-related transcriptional regulator [Psychromicrobium sp. YIM B11713]|uniref:LuxR C-terminal-related transcriptional regulator n=1 Tax=Psychromicrobium sp. YIM B11713 TaxID=3145233 RepID=UPI00374F6D28